jgi:O-acetyl-ADP-ribose deacetylase (regulator of RNase III)
MGPGIALQFNNAFPKNFKAYAAACSRGELQPGRMFVFETGSMTNPKYTINFPTKRHWRRKSRLSDIESGLASLTKEITVRDIRSIAIPPLGSGLGGLYWPEVRPLIEHTLLPLADVKVVVYEPTGQLDSPAMARTREAPAMTPGRADLVVLMYRYLAGLLDPFVSLLELHKLMYFMQEAGQSLKLRFAKVPYGPYAENLRHVLHAVEGHLISGYWDGGDAPNKQIQLVPGAVDEAMTYLNDDATAKERFAKVSDLVTGFESPFGLELLSTVHWVVSREGAEAEVIHHVYDWSERKELFSERQIKLAFEVLSAKGWFGLDSTQTSAVRNQDRL